MIKAVYLVTKRGLEIFTDGAQESIVKKIEEDNKEQNDRLPYIIHIQPGGEPAYMASQSGDTYVPVNYPEPKDYGLTAPELHAKGITYRDALALFLKLRTKGKSSLWSQTKRVMSLIAPIAIIAFLIFIMVIAMQG